MSSKNSKEKSKKHAYDRELILEGIFVSFLIAAGISTIHGFLYGFIAGGIFLIGFAFVLWFFRDNEQ